MIFDTTPGAVAMFSAKQYATLQFRSRAEVNGSNDDYSRSGIVFS